MSMLQRVNASMKHVRVSENAYTCVCVLCKYPHIKYFVMHVQPRTMCVLGAVCVHGLCMLPVYT